MLHVIWGGKKKVKARNETIIFKYKEKFGLNNLPSDKQYWTLCGLLTDGKGRKNRGNEFYQVTRTNPTTGTSFITEQQFHGVERVESIYMQNKNAFPHLNIFHGDIFTVMNNFAANPRNEFNPGIVNLDLISMVDRSADYLPKILEFIGSYDPPIMLVCNVVMKTFYNTPENGVGTDDHNRFINRLNKNAIYKKMVNQVWERDSNCYVYKGNDERSFSTMSSYIFYKNVRPMRLS